MPADKDERQISEKVNNRSKAISALICLSGCAVNDVIPDRAYFSGFTSDDFQSLHDLSEYLSLNSITYTAIEKTAGSELPDNDIFKSWKEERDQEIYKSLMFDCAWEKLRIFLEENGIWYLLLKGLPMKKFYPEPGMRQMADIDVLFDVGFEKKVRDYFVSRGYKVETYRQGDADAYLKPPFYNFELHRVLFTYQNSEIWSGYYKNIKDKLILNTGSAYGYHFTDEDFYIYCTVHAYKHFHTHGTGLRSLLDCYVYLKVKRDDLDWDYIQKEIKTLSLDDFERSCRQLSEKLFSDPVNFSLRLLTAKEREFLTGFLRFGTYGTIANRVRNKLQEIGPREETPSLKTKAKYLLERAFPDAETFREYYPFFYNHKWLMPVGYVYRLMYKGITNGGQMMDELKALRGEKKPTGNNGK